MPSDISLPYHFNYATPYTAFVTSCVCIDTARYKIVLKLGKLCFTGSLLHSQILTKTVTIATILSTEVLLLTAEDLHCTRHNRNRWRKPKHLCGTGSHHYQCKEPASTVGTGQLQHRHTGEHG